MGMVGWCRNDQLQKVKTYSQALTLAQKEESDE
jgi:hypothetical protein